MSATVSSHHLSCKTFRPSERLKKNSAWCWDDNESLLKSARVAAKYRAELSCVYLYPTCSTLSSDRNRGTTASTDTAPLLQEIRTPLPVPTLSSGRVAVYWASSSSPRLAQCRSAANQGTTWRVIESEVYRTTGSSASCCWGPGPVLGSEDSRGLSPALFIIIIIIIITYCCCCSYEYEA